MKLRTIAIILVTLTLAFGSSTAFAKSKHHKATPTSQKSHHAAKLHHKGKHAAPAVTTPTETTQKAQ
jgi:type IV secretory pathway VirB6-like protein